MTACYACANVPGPAYIRCINVYTPFSLRLPLRPKPSYVNGVTVYAILEYCVLCCRAFVTSFENKLIGHKFCTFHANKS